MRQRTRLAILECDTPFPSVYAKYGGYGGVIQALLDSVAQADGYSSINDLADISKYQIVDHPETYPNLDDIDAILLTGSKHDSFLDTPWILTLVQFVQDALAHSHVRMLGVCFGHQIVARALGAKVGRNDNGWEAAVHDVQLTLRGKEVFKLERLRIHQSHRDAVQGIPPGLELLGSSPVCENQGMYKPKKILTVQGHPEYNGTIVREIIETRHNIGVFDEETFKTHIKKVDLPHDGQAVGRAFLKFMANEI